MTMRNLIVRNRKLFFRDKGMLFSALITPFILIILYATFLANVYRESFEGALPEGFKITDKLLNGTVAGQLAAALLAVSCVTVTFCVALTMVQDRVSGADKDFAVSPVKRSKVFLAYYISTALNSMMVNFVALALCFVYMGIMGWFLSVTDVLLIILDEILLVLFGTAVGSIVIYPAKTQGQMSAIGTIISAGYGFICGAYMPISNFGEGLQKTMSFLPSTYGTALIKNHMLAGAFTEMKAQGFPDEVVEGISKSLDCKPEFFGNVVTPEIMMVVVLVTIVVLTLIYLLLTRKNTKK